MNLNIEEIKKKIADHFANLTPERLEQNLVNAGIQVYTDLELNFLDDEEIQSSEKEFCWAVSGANNLYEVRMAGISVATSQATGFVCEVSCIEEGMVSRMGVRMITVDSNIGSVYFPRASASDETFFREVCA